MNFNFNHIFPKKAFTLNSHVWHAAASKPVDRFSSALARSLHLSKIFNLVYDFLLFPLKTAEKSELENRDNFHLLR